MSNSEWPTNPADFIKYMQENMPKVERTPNGYELRAHILGLAQTQAFQPVEAKIRLLGATISSKWEGDKIISECEFPTADQVLEIAEKFNNFISGKTPNK